MAGYAGVVVDLISVDALPILGLECYTGWVFSRKAVGFIIMLV